MKRHAGKTTKVSKGEPEIGTMKKIHILGAGAIGKLYGAALIQDVAVTFITRSSQQQRWQFQPFHSDTSVPCECSTVTANELYENSIDTLIVCVKAYQVESALTDIAHALKANTKILLLHNGMGVWEKVKGMLPTKIVAQGLSSHGALWNSDSSTLIHTGLGSTFIGPLSDSATEDEYSFLVEMLKARLPECEWRESIQLDQWRKLAVNAVINPLTGYYQFKNGQVLNKEFVPVIESVSREIAVVMNAKGFSIDSTDLIESVHQVAKATAENYSSTNRDIHFGRMTELEFINGYVVNLGESLGVDVAENKRLLSLCESKAETDL
ncbi:MAG: 2-dehydropantoate 2-reductase [Cellvibrionaceae bacterium]